MNTAETTWTSPARTHSKVKVFQAMLHWAGYAKLLNICLVWRPDVLCKNVLLSNDLQRAMLSLFRRLLGVRQAVSSNCILDEVCAKPLQQY
jgi:hypothetical protein